MLCWFNGPTLIMAYYWISAGQYFTEIPQVSAFEWLLSYLSFLRFGGIFGIDWPQVWGRLQTWVFDGPSGRFFWLKPSASDTHFRLLNGVCFKPILVFQISLGAHNWGVCLYSCMTSVQLLSPLGRGFLLLRPVFCWHVHDLNPFWQLFIFGLASPENVWISRYWILFECPTL